MARLHAWINNMDTKPKKSPFNLAVESKVHCLTYYCANNIHCVCNLKGIGIDENGLCSGLVPIKKKKDKDNE